MTKTVRRWTRIFGSIAAVAVLASACSSASSSSGQAGSTSGAKSLTTVAIGSSSSAADQLIPLYVEEKGLFRQHGINVKYSLIPAAELLSAVVSGRVPVGVFGGPQPEESVLAGASLRWVSVWADTPDLVFIAGPGITSFSQLVGKPIGSTAAGTLTTILSDAVLEQHGVALSSVHQVLVGSPSSLVASFASGTIDGAVTGPPLSNEALAKRPGSTALLDLSKTWKWPFAGFAVNGAWAKQNPAVVVGLLQAMSTGVKDWMTDPAKAESVIEQEVTGLTPKTAAIAWRSTLPTLTGSLVPSLAAEQVVMRTIASKYPQLSHMSPSAFVDTSYLRQAGLLSN
jgi:ABC-type nitrate/sulfonate/bicarbonate transport system substrate-binding protein